MKPNWPSIMLMPALCVGHLLYAEETDSEPVLPPPAIDETLPLEPATNLPDSQGRSLVAAGHSTLLQRRQQAARLAAAAAQEQMDPAPVSRSDGLQQKGNRWEYDGRLALGGGYDSNPRRQGDIVDSDNDGGGAIKADGLLRGAWSNGPTRIGLATSGAWNYLPNVEAADTGHLGLSALGRHLWYPQETGALMLNGSWDSRVWYEDNERSAVSHVAAVGLSQIRLMRVHTLSLTAMNLDYEDESGDDGTGVWLGWRGWFLGEEGSPLPRWEVQTRLGQWFAEDDYTSIQASLARSWRSQSSPPKFGTFDLESGIGGEYRWRSETENQLLFNAHVEGGVWLNSILKAALFTRWDVSDSDTDRNDYDRLQIGALLIANF